MSRVELRGLGGSGCGEVRCSRAPSRARLGRRPRTAAAAAALAGVAFLASGAPFGGALAQAVRLKTCTRAFGAWMEARDARLRRLEARPTLLGLDNTWCATSLQPIADLKSRLDGVRQACAGLDGDEKIRSDELIARAAQLLDRVQTCAGPTVTAVDPRPWQTSVRTAPPVPSPKTQVREAAASVEPRRASGPAATEKGREAREAKPRGQKMVTAAGEVPPEAEGPRPAGAESPSAPGSEAPPPRAFEVKATQGKAREARPPEAKVTEAKVSKASERTAVPPSAPVEDDECLVVTRTALATYLIENRNCQPENILTAIELRRPGQGVRCFTKKVASQIAIAGEEGSEPQINFQCREGSDGCAEDVLRGMFPECQPG